MSNNNQKDTFIFTLETPPAGMEIELVYTLIYAHFYTKISNDQFTFRKTESKTLQDGFEILTSVMPEGANAIMAVKHSAVEVKLKEGSFMYNTLMGTPVRLVGKQS